MKIPSTKKRFWQTILVALSITTIFGSCQDTFDEMLGICPEVESTSPADKATGVQLNKIIAVTFNEAMNPASIKAEAFSLRVMNSTGGIDVDIPGKLTYDATNNTMSFAPNAPLAPNTTYTGRVEPIVSDVLGNVLQAPYVWTFTTGSAPTVIATNPANMSTGNALNKPITAKFSAKMNPETIKASSFIIKSGTTAIAGVVTYMDSTATFTPSADLLPGTTYTGTITVEAANTDGIPLASEYTWTFNTGAAPSVISVDPKDQEKGVAVNKSISAVFSEMMDGGTINTASFTLKTGMTPVPGTVTYAELTAVFKPFIPLIPNTTYTATISKTVKNPQGIAITGDFVWSFTTAAPDAIVAPLVISTDPTSNAVNVAFDKVIKANFSQTMDLATINGATFLLKQGNTVIPGTVTYSGTTASFTPSSPLSSGLVYTATITTGVKSSAGAALENNYVWNFTTVVSETAAAPTVTSTDPTNNAVNIAFNKVIKATFSQAMDPASITATTFTLKQGNTVVAGTVTYSGTTASFTPNSPLSSGGVYTATITTGAKNTTGIALAANYVWNFTTVVSQTATAPTVTSTDPANNDTGVSLNKVIKANFSQVMDPASITGATFTLKQGNTTVTGTVTYSGSTASFTPNSPLSASLEYTATITTGAKNTSGTALASNYEWTFTTGIPVAPTVTSTDPANNATNVPLNKVIKATFSEAMDPATITGTTFTLKQGNTTVTGTVTYSGTTASFTPNSPLSASLVYTATITTGAKNTAGTALANDYVWTFTTAAAVAPTVTSTDPTNNATNVPLNKVIKATFSEPMNPATITGTTFTLKQGNTTVTGTVTYSGTTASFTPNNPLSPNVTYTATITTGAQNLAGTGLANDYVWTFQTLSQQSANFVDLKTAGRFGIFAATGISNNAGFSQIRNLDVGITPGARSSVTGFPPATIINGAIYASDDASPAGVAAMLIQAKKDLTEAYLFAEGATSPAPVTVAGDQGGKTLAPGIYKSNSTLLIQAGDLTLDAQGDPNAVWIFQIASGFTTVGGAGGSIILSGGAQASNIFWQVGSSATIGDNTKFKGNVLALTSITMNSNATVVGRMLVINGAVVMTNTNIIEKP
ncbi:Ig-like domain-containing protein [Algoriphagus sp.]|uniref:Ig-like domain-containing protein n=1 Tax=Algoriphagus sp. TaxID=1872435 RepID=UPI002715B7CB|nr:Ig-like domain-containing protein [Algoriphagus sp.]MDO8965188.1 Ig-like domain-containing protein [Algoriphagus sp.]MDP3198979.1 Ig-like domain-containing protein [Algoriphagus sp.]